MNTLMIISGCAHGLDSINDWGTCMDAQRNTAALLIPHTSRSGVDELGDGTLAADKVLVF